MEQTRFWRNRQLVLGSIMVLLGSVLQASCSYVEHRAEYIHNNGKVIIAVELVPIHAFLAEYDRFATLTINGKDAVKKKLFPDTGGYASTNLYRCTQTNYMLKGYFDSWVVDVVAKTVVEGNCQSSERGHLGVFEGGGSRPWKFYSSSERMEMKLEPKAP
jgi:hypothetical protein